MVYEALAGAAVVLSASLLADPVALEHPPWPAHPGWLVVLLLAARHGFGGFLAGIAAAGPAAGLALLFTGSGLGALTGAPSSGDLFVALGAILVGCVANSHHKRTRSLAGQLAEATARARDGDAAVTQLTAAAIALRARVDRTENSLAFLSGVAARIDLGGPRDGAAAALELAIARTGARAGLVQIVDNGRLRTLASQGAWNLDSPEPPALHRDRTAHAAVDRARLVRACEVEDVRPDDSDLAAPVIGSNGLVTGMIALRGVPVAAMKPAALSDLGVVARWLARALDAGRDASNHPSVDAG